MPVQYSTVRYFYGTEEYSTVLPIVVPTVVPTVVPLVTFFAVLSADRQTDKHKARSIRHQKCICRVASHATLARIDQGLHCDTFPVYTINCVVFKSLTSLKCTFQLPSNKRTVRYRTVRYNLTARNPRTVQIWSTEIHVNNEIRTCVKFKIPEYCPVLSDATRNS